LIFCAGAGAAGSSSAYYLRRFLANSTVDKLPLDITVYEKHSYVGGRSTTVNAYDDPAFPIELGASIFVSVNKNLVNAANEFGLSVSSASAKKPRIEEESDILGIYDGKELLFTYPEGKWWSLAKLVYRYGLMAPYRTKKLTEATVGKFLQMYEAPYFPFASLSETVEAVGLLPATGTTGQQFLEQNGISEGFAQELIQASTRVNYGQNLGLIHGLETVVCMAAAGAMSVEGGNWQIFRGMIDASKVDLRLQTAVTSLSKDEDGQWVVASKTDGKATTTEIYDSVIIAGPLQFSNIAIEAELEKKPDVIPYVTLHVTLIASPYRLDPAAFGLKAGQPVPQSILTTLNETERSDPTVARGEGKDAVGNSGFFSISTLRSVERPDLGIEYIYKVFSPERFSNERIMEKLEVPTGEDDRAITWIHRHVWKSYPYEYPRVTFEESKLAEGLWYTAGIESFISTMETSSLMGMNVAQLVVNEWVEEKKKEEEEKRVKEEQEKELLATQQQSEEIAAEREAITGDEL
jgi:prenylcysteine oxidase/farnesylcysteine lyase